MKSKKDRFAGENDKDKEEMIEIDEVWVDQLKAFPQFSRKFKSSFACS